MRGLKGRVAVVAGAAPGTLGALTAMRLAQEGMLVVVADADEAAVGTVVEEVIRAGGTAVPRCFDITDDQSYRDLIEFAATHFDGLHGLVNFAGQPQPPATGRNIDAPTGPGEPWKHTFDVVLIGYMHGIRHALPIMIEQGSGSIVNTMLSADAAGRNETGAFGAARSGLVEMTRYSAALGGGSGVRTNLVVPVGTLTCAEQEIVTEQALERSFAAAHAPSGGQPEDVATVVAFLISDDGAFVNGQSLLARMARAGPEVLPVTAQS